jgi:UDP-glucose 4-epimerase
MRILVSGGNGYVGRALCRSLINEHSLCIVDNLRSSRNRFDDFENRSLQWIDADVRNARAIAVAVADFQPEIIIHLAAIHFIPECEKDIELAVSTNVLGTANLASVCPPNCRFVFASTAAVYQPDVSPHDERLSPTGPSDVYGWTKLQGEQYVRYFAEKRNYPACIVRLFNVIGPGETNPHVLPEIIAQLKAGRTKLHLGNLDAKRDYVHMDDVVSGFVAVATRGNVVPGYAETVNLGTQQCYSVKQLLQYLEDCSGIPFEIQPDPTRMRPSDRPSLSANIARIQQQFQWKPSIGIAEAINNTWLKPDIPTQWIDRYR